jgi:hypothetical protein
MVVDEGETEMTRLATICEGNHRFILELSNLAMPIANASPEFQP